MLDILHISYSTALAYVKDMTVTTEHFLMFLLMVQTGEIVVDD